MAEVVLTKCCVLDTDSQKVKLSFKLDHYSKLKKRVISKCFYFCGHTWKLQVTKKDGHLGMFLRWYGTTTTEEYPEKFNCKTVLKFSVLNKFDPENSVSEGTSKNYDVFEHLHGGIGYSKIIKTSELEQISGYLYDDKIYLQLLLKVKSTTYWDTIQCDNVAEGDHFTGFKFPFYGTKWSVVFFPNGEKDESKSEKNVEEKNDDPKEELKMASIYLNREVTPKHELLRHNVSFKVSVTGGHTFTLEQHFHNNDSNTYGSPSFMTVAALKELTSSNTVEVSVTFLNIVAYSYFAYNIDGDDEEKISFEEGFHFHDHCNIPWNFSLGHSAQTGDDPFYAYLQLFNKNTENEKQKGKQKDRIFHVSWLVDILSPTDIEESITFMSHTKRQVRDAIFSASNQTDAVEFPISIDEMRKSRDLLVDNLGNLCVRVSVLCCNHVKQIPPEEITKLYNDIWHYRSQKCKEQREEDNKEEQEEKFDVNVNENEVLVQSLFDHIDSYERYIKDLENNPLQAKTIHEETSISILKEKSRPSLTDCEHLVILAKHVKKIIQTLPLSIVKIIHAGAFGHGTIVANFYQLDFIVQLADYTEQSNRMPLLLNIIKERIKEHCSTNPSDMSIKRCDSNTPLLYAHRFYVTGNALLLKLGEVNVTILLSRALDYYGNYEDVYKKASKAKKLTMHRFIIISSERQTEFIDRQTDLCKDLICVVKAWSNRIKWKDADSRPSSYLLSLLLINAYESTEKLSIAKTPSFEKEVLTEFGINVLDEYLYVEWNHFYNPDDYPIKREETFRHPVIRDPALPYHNVCDTGIGNWKQFRQETEDWIVSLVY